MKRIATMFVAALLAFVPQSCVTNSKPLGEMDEQSFAQLKQDLDDTAFIGGYLIKEKASPKAVTAMQTVLSQLTAAINAGGVSLPTSISALLDQLAPKLAEAGVEPIEIDLIKSAIRLVDRNLGGIKLGIDGVGSERTREIVLAIAQGLERGLR